MAEKKGWRSFWGGYSMADIEEIMEQICDTCHWPYVCSEDELEKRCEHCAVEGTIKRTLEKA